MTTYEFKPDPGVKYSRVTGLVDDLCLALKAESIRIDRIPGKAYVGIEVPNQKREIDPPSRGDRIAKIHRIGFAADARSRQDDRRLQIRRRSRQDAASADRRRDRCG